MIPIDDDIQRTMDWIASGTLGYWNTYNLMYWGLYREYANDSWQRKGSVEEYAEMIISGRHKNHVNYLPD